MREDRMRRKENLITGLIALVVVATIFLMVPAAANADILPPCRFYGPVTLDGQNVPPGGTVSAWIDGIAAGTGTTYLQGSDSWYILDSPENTGGLNKNGGQNGDMVRFSVKFANGSVFQDPATGSWKWASTVYHRIALSSGVISPLAITTSALPDGAQGRAYTPFTMTATGGVGAYTWNSSDLPAALTINPSTGVISGNATSSGDFTVHITVTDSASPTKNTQTRTYTLHISASGELIITTSELTRWPVEVLPPASLLTLAAPGWIINQAYSTTLVASGGTGALTWSASNLPTGLTIDPATGIVSGTPTVADSFTITFHVHDAANPQNIVNKELTLKIYMIGDANGNGSVTIADVTYVERAILGLSAPTAGCDANISNTNSIADVTKIERIILHLP
jgi:hypothetical protein